MSAEGLSFRILSSADGQRINELFARAYGRPRSLAQWQWEYGRLPGGQPILWGAARAGALVGHYALIPLELDFAGQTVSSAKAESAMVDPAERGRGICSRLVEMTLLDAAQRGIQIVWGFPNRQSFDIMERSGRVSIGGLYSYIRFLRPARIAWALVGRRWAHRASRGGQPKMLPDWWGDMVPRDPDVSVVDRLDGRFDDLWSKARGTLGITLVRSREYLDWRFLQNPYGRYLLLACGHHDGGLSGYMVSTLKVESGRRAGYIVDFLLRPGQEEAFDRLLRETLRFLEAGRADMATLFINPGHPSCGHFLPALEGHRFHPRKHFKRFSVKIFSEPLAARGLAFEQWYLTGTFAEGVEF